MNVKKTTTTSLFLWRRAGLRGTGLPNPSRETKQFSGANEDREIFVFPVQLTMSWIDDLSWLIDALTICVTIHTCVTVSTMPISTPSKPNQFLFAVIICHRMFRRTFFGTLSPRSIPQLPDQRPDSNSWDVRTGRSRGTLEHRASAHRTALPCSLHFLADSFRLPTSSGEIGTSLLPCAPLRSPPEPLFTSHTRGIVPT